jgi:hypothetical protein
MTRLSISGGKLIIDVQGLHKIWAFKSRLEIPIEHISAVRRAADERVKGIRLPGTSIPGVITAGTYYEANERPVFWDVCDREKAIAIDLEDERFSTIVIEVADPEGSMRKILNALGTWTIANV